MAIFFGGDAMITHTLGPWKIKDSSVSKTGYPAIFRIIGGGKNKVLPFALKSLVYDVAMVDGKENASLIAAAPELLKALKIAKVCLKENRGPSLEEFKIIQGAIAKAEGK